MAHRFEGIAFGGTNGATTCALTLSEKARTKKIVARGIQGPPRAPILPRVALGLAANYDVLISVTDVSVPASPLRQKELRLFLGLRTLKSMNRPEHRSNHARALVQGTMTERGGSDTFLTLWRRNIDQDQLAVSQWCCLD